jgi:methionine-rich copper-binding protein CopC
MMVFRRTAASLLIATLALLAFTTAAAAHTSLKSSNPAEGAVLAAAPGQIELTFDEAVTLPADPVQVTGPDGTKWAAGKAAIAGTVVTVPVQPIGPAGQYTITWEAIAGDGDTIRGTIRFALTTAVTTPSATATTAPAAPATTAPATTVITALATTSQVPASTPVPAAQGTADCGFPTWGWILVAVAAVAAIATPLAVRFRRSNPPNNS